MSETGAKAGTASSTVSRLQMILFAFPALPHAFIAMPLNIVIPTFYAANTTVTLAMIAAVTTTTRLADAITDPLIGYLSDRTRSRLGPRKPWVLAGTLLCALSIFFLFQPPKDAGWHYYAIWSFGLYFGFTLFEIPRSAWSTELSRDYFTRARIGGWVSIFNIVGSLVFWLVIIGMYSVTGTTEINAGALSAIAWLYVILMPVGIILAVVFVSSGAVGSEALSTVSQFVRSLRRNGPLQRYLAVIGMWGLGQGAYLSVILIFVSDYLQLGAIFPFIMIAFFVIQIAAMPLWVHIIGRIGKHRTWAIALVAGALSPYLMLLLPPGPQSLVPLIAIACVTALFNAPTNLTPTAVLGDVVDYDIMKCRANNAGNIFALNILLVKATMALGTGFAFWVLDAYGYKVGGQNGEAATLALLAVYLLFPTVTHVTAALLIWRFPLDSKKHSTIRRRIERRAATPTLLSPAE